MHDTFFFFSIFWMKIWFDLIENFNTTFRNNLRERLCVEFLTLVENSIQGGKNKLKSFHHMMTMLETQPVFHIPLSIFGDIELRVTSRHSSPHPHISKHKRNYHISNWFPPGCFVRAKSLACVCVWLRALNLSKAANAVILIVPPSSTSVWHQYKRTTINRMKNRINF